MNLFKRRVEAKSEEPDREKAETLKRPDMAKNAALRALQGRIASMKFSARHEKQGAYEVERQVAALEKQRITRISLARLEGVPPFTEDLDEQLQALRCQVADAAAIEASLAEMAEAEARELNQAIFDARKELAAALDARFSEAADRYNEIARELAVVALELYAVRELMITAGAGNSNGVDISISLPHARPGDGSVRAPMFAFTDRECRNAVKRRSEEIAHELTAFGFVF